MYNGHSFDGEGRCVYCEVAAHNSSKYICNYPENIERILVKSTQRKRSDVIRQFEDTRSIHNGDVSKAAEVMGMSPSALDRALYRAKKAGWEGEFKCLSKKSRKEITVVFEPEHEGAQL